MATKSLDDRLDVVEARLHQLQVVRHQVIEPVKTYLQRLSTLSEKLELVVNKLSVFVGLSNEHQRCDQAKVPLALVFPCEPQRGAEFGDLRPEVVRDGAGVTQAEATASPTEGCVDVCRPQTDLTLHKGLELREKGKQINCAHDAGLGSRIAIPRPDDLRSLKNHELQGLLEGRQEHGEPDFFLEHFRGMGSLLLKPLDKVESQPMELGCSQGSSPVFDRTGIGQEQGLCTAEYEGGEDLSTQRDVGLGLQALRCKDLGPNDFGYEVKRLGPRGLTEPLGSRDAAMGVTTLELHEAWVLRQPCRAGAMGSLEKRLDICILQRSPAGFCCRGGLGMMMFHRDDPALEEGGVESLRLGLMGIMGLGLWVHTSGWVAIRNVLLGLGAWEVFGAHGPNPGKSPASTFIVEPTIGFISSYRFNHKAQFPSMETIKPPKAQNKDQQPPRPFKRVTTSLMQLPKNYEREFRHEEGRLAARLLQGNGRLFWRTGIGQAQGFGTAWSHLRSTVIENQSSPMMTKYTILCSFQFFHQFYSRTGICTIDSALALISKLCGANEITTLVIGYMEFGKLGIVGNRSQVVPLRYVGAVATIVAQFHAKKGFKIFWKMSQMDIEPILSNLSSILLGGINLCDQQVGRQVSATEHIAILIPCYYMVLLIVMSIASHSKFPNFLNKHIRPVFQKLLEERKLDSLKALVDIAFYTIHQGLGQIVLFLVQLVSKYMPLKQTTAKMSLTYVECLLYKAYHICISLNKFPHIGMGLYQFAIDNIMGGCTHLYAIDHRKWVHGYLNQCGLEFVVVIGTAVANRYGRGGSMAQADKMFEEMPENETWVFSALLFIFVVRGFSNEPLDMLGEIEMSGLTTNQVTILGILSACSQVVLVIKNCWSVDVIQDNHSSEPPVHHYACLVDIRGRVGLFQVMERVFGDILFRRGRFWAAACIRCQARYNITVGVFVWLSNLPLWQAKDCAMILPLGAAAMRVQPYHPMSKGWPPPHVHLEDKVVFWGRGIDRIQQDVSRGMTSWLG